MDTLLKEWLEKAPKEIRGYYKTTKYRYIHSELGYFEVWVKDAIAGPDGLEESDDTFCYKMERGVISPVECKKVEECH